MGKRTPEGCARPSSSWARCGCTTPRRAWGADRRVGLGRELRRAARDDAVGSWLAARARAEVRNTGDGVRATFLHLARHDVAAAAKACAAAGRTRAALCLAARDERIPIVQVEFARAARSRRRPAARGARARVLGVAAGGLEDDVG